MPPDLTELHSWYPQIRTCHVFYECEDVVKSKVILNQIKNQSSLPHFLCSVSQHNRFTEKSAFRLWCWTNITNCCTDTQAYCLHTERRVLSFIFYVFWNATVILCRLINLNYFIPANSWVFMHKITVPTENWEQRGPPQKTGFLLNQIKWIVNYYTAFLWHFSSLAVHSKDITVEEIFTN